MLFRVWRSLWQESKRGRYHPYYRPHVVAFNVHLASDDGSAKVYSVKSHSIELTNTVMDSLAARHGDSPQITCSSKVQFYARCSTSRIGQQGRLRYISKRLRSVTMIRGLASVSGILWRSCPHLCRVPMHPSVIHPAHMLSEATQVNKAGC